MIRRAGELLDRLRAIHTAIRATVVAACERSAVEHLSQPVADDAGDTIFAIDRISEETLLAHFGDLAGEWPLRLVAEGLGAAGQMTLPEQAQPEIVIIVDPIDGTRGLMYQKRPAWILTGVAAYHGRLPTLADIELAVQTEVPLVKQHLCDSFWASEAQVVGGERLNRLTGERQPLAPQPSRAATIAQGFGNIARFFPGPRGLMAEIDDELIERVLGAPPPGRALAFEDQYISSAGQLYELLMGHDRWAADLRALVPGYAGLCCHPYDLCTELIARAAGVRVTGASGEPLTAPLDVDSAVAWMGFANDSIQAQVRPVLQNLLKERGLL
jgi:hypothetical protein